MKLYDLMPLIGDDRVIIIDEVYQGDTLYNGVPDKIGEPYFMEWNVVTVHGGTEYDDDENPMEDLGHDYVMIFVQDPDDVVN